MGSYYARGTIQPSRFVKISASQDNYVEAAGSGELAIGVSAEWSKKTQLPGATGEAAASGENIAVYDIGSLCLVQVGAACTRGDALRAGANGLAYTATSGDYVNATALESGSANDLVRVQVARYKN